MQKAEHDEGNQNTSPGLHFEERGPQSGEKPTFLDQERSKKGKSGEPAEEEAAIRKNRVVKKLLERNRKPKRPGGEKPVRSKRPNVLPLHQEITPY